VTLDELPSWALAHLEAGRVGHLGFVDDRDRPRVLPVTYALFEDAVWSAIDDKPKRSGQPARVRYLRRRPHAALCVDVYADDWSRLAWVQLLGAVELVDARDGAGALDALAVRYAPYRERRPAGPLLRLAVERALHWRADHSLQPPG
jgi:PPOX class probable F420-dependent enzyme